MPVFSDGLSTKLSEKLSARLGSVQATLRELVSLRRAEVVEADDVVAQFEGVEVDPSEYAKKAAEIIEEP